jgi:hypothetical protein
MESAGIVVEVPVVVPVGVVLRTVSAKVSDSALLLRICFVPAETMLVCD